jgi:GGDEF domain-containing protein
MSWGIASSEDTQYWSESRILLNAADRRAYEVKQNVRDAVNAGEEYDPLTGLPDIRKFNSNLQREIRECNRSGGLVYLGLLDVVGFSNLISQLGPEDAWDLFRSSVASISTNGFNFDYVARFYDSDKIVILKHLERDTPDAEISARESCLHLLDELRSKRLAKNGTQYMLDFACGMVTYSPGLIGSGPAEKVASNPDLLGRIALHLAREAGGSRERFREQRYSP